MTSEFQAYIEAIAADTEECQAGTSLDRPDSQMPSGWHREPPLLRQTDGRSRGRPSRSCLPGEMIAYHGLV